LSLLDFNSVGIQSAGGAGMALAEWMDTGNAPMDLWDVDIRRMMPFQANRSVSQNRVFRKRLACYMPIIFPIVRSKARAMCRQSPRT
jgi:4-methylaminobutanoate oxidase (formaldehyde-forming)